MAIAASSRQQVQVCIGKAGLPLGSLVYLAGWSSANSQA